LLITEEIFSAISLGEIIFTLVEIIGSSIFLQLSRSGIYPWGPKLGTDRNQ